MICPRHRCAATKAEHGRFYCAECFDEAVRFAEQMSADQVVRRLNGRKG